MLKFIDRWLEKKIMQFLHANKEKIIKNTVQLFHEKYPNQNVSEFEHLLNAEANRIYPIVDRSILRERLQRAKVTFWVTAIIGTLLAGIITGFTSGAALPFMPPLVTACIAWLINLITIPNSYNQRIQGAMDSVLAQYELQHNKQDNQQELNVNDQINEKIVMTYKQLHEFISHEINDTLNNDYHPINNNHSENNNFFSGNNSYFSENNSYFSGNSSFSGNNSSFSGNNSSFSENSNSFSGNNGSFSGRK